MTRNFGWLKDVQPIDPTKTFLAALTRSGIDTSRPLPDSVSFMHDVTQIGPLFQVELGTCVTQATMQAMRLFWKLNYGMVDPLTMSRLGWYWDARAEMGETGHDSGLYPATAFDVLRRRGYALEKYWPYDEREVFTPPPAEYRTHMVDQQDAIIDMAIEGYMPTEKLYYTKLALTMNQPVVAGIECDDGFMGYTGVDGEVWQRKPGSRSLGRHYILIIGYSDDKSALLCTNSWEDWGMVLGGCSFFWMSYAEFMSERVADVRAIKAAAPPSEML